MYYSIINLEYLMSLENNKKENFEDNIIKEKYQHCKNCGAILKSNKCEYCKTEYIGIENDNEEYYEIHGGIGNQKIIK